MQVLGSIPSGFPFLYDYPRGGPPIITSGVAGRQDARDAVKAMDLGSDQPGSETGRARGACAEQGAGDPAPNVRVGADGRRPSPGRQQTLSSGCAAVHACVPRFICDAIDHCVAPPMATPLRARPLLCALQAPVLSKPNADDTTPTTRPPQPMFRAGVPSASARPPPVGQATASSASVTYRFFTTRIADLTKAFSEGQSFILSGMVRGYGGLADSLPPAVGSPRC